MRLNPADGAVSYFWSLLDGNPATMGGAACQRRGDSRIAPTLVVMDRRYVAKCGAHLGFALVDNYQLAHQAHDVKLPSGDKVKDNRVLKRPDC